MKYYKVVRANGNKLFSALEHDKPEYIREYRIGEFIYDESGKFLCAFDSLVNAKFFASDYKYLYRIRIYECECVGINDSSINPITNYYKGYHNWPEGTVHAYGVKLINLVYCYNQVIPDKTKFCFTKDGFDVGYYQYINNEWCGIVLGLYSDKLYHDSEYTAKLNNVYTLTNYVNN